MQGARQNAAAPPQRNVQPGLGAVEKNHKCTGYRSLGAGAADSPESRPSFVPQRTVKRQPATSNRPNWSPIALFATRDEK